MRSTSEEGKIETITIIVPAAGCGARAALNGNKVLAPLLNRPLLSWTLHALWNANPTEWVVACKPDEHGAIKGAFRADMEATFRAGLQRGAKVHLRPLEFIEAGGNVRNQSAMPIVLVEGGATRQESVWNAVRASRGDWIVVHDAARPCLSRALLEATLRAAKETGAAIAALPVSDTVKRAAPDGSIAQTLNRDEIWLAQTPQIFRRQPFLEALQSAHDDGWHGTDCASIMERAGHRVMMVEGETDNLKVTYAPDLERAATILAAR